MLYLAKDIKYSLDDEDKGLEIHLPEDLAVECDSPDEIANAISDETGFLVESFEYEIL